MFRPLKGWYAILNNLHFPMVEGIAFYALYKSTVLIIPCKADNSCLLIGLPDEIYKKSVALSKLEVKFFIILCSNLKETLPYESYMVSNIKKCIQCYNSDKIFFTCNTLNLLYSSVYYFIVTIIIFLRK